MGALGNAIKPMLPSTELLYFSLIHTGLKVNENRGHYKINERIHMAFGTSLILDAVSKVSRADIPPPLPLYPAQLKPVRYGCAQLQQSRSLFAQLNVMKPSRVCSFQCLSLWV